MTPANKPIRAPRACDYMRVFAPAVCDMQSKPINSRCGASLLYRLKPFDELSRCIFQQRIIEIPRPIQSLDLINPGDLERAGTGLKLRLYPEARCGRSGRSLLAMPIRLYFMWVGSALLMALYCADKWLPDPSTHAHSSIPPGERVNLRIRSDHRWPERVVFDTAHPQMPLSSTFRSISEVIPGQDPAWTEQRGARDAFASMK